jgi:hypothetical protein
MSDPFGRLQWWLQGHPTPTRGYVTRPWMLMWIGNRISDARYWLWRASRSPSGKERGE